MIDKLEIRLSRVGFQYPQQPWLLKDISVTIKQGQIIGILGYHGSGKSTLMRLLGHTMFPSEGDIFVPGHLRPLLVGQEIDMFEHETAWFNLTFGLPAESPFRVKQILQALEMETTLKLVTNELTSLGREGELDIPGSTIQANAPNAKRVALNSVTGFSLKGLPHGERAKIHIARALITNPEVLLMHKPLSHFDDKVADMFLNAFSVHCDNRGYMVPASSRDDRRPRTLIISPTTLKELDFINVVWEIKDCGVVVHEPGNPEASKRWEKEFLHG